MSSHKAMLGMLVFVILATGHIDAGEVINGTFTQPSNGLLSEPVIGPSTLTIDNDTCVLVYQGRRATGSVRRAHDQLLILDLDDPQTFSRAGYTVATRLCVTRYHDNVLLIDLESLTECCNAINSRNRLGPTGTGAVVLVRPATEKEKQGIGELANPLIKPLVLNEEISGTITSLDRALVERVVPDTRVGTIQGYSGKCSLGRSSHVYPGMSLHYSQETRGTYGIAWVVAVSDKESTIFVWQIERAMSPPREGTVLNLRVP